MLWHLGSLYLFAKYRSRVQVISTKDVKDKEEIDGRTEILLEISL